MRESPISVKNHGCGIAQFFLVNPSKPTTFLNYKNIQMIQYETYIFAPNEHEVRNIAVQLFDAAPDKFKPNNVILCTDHKIDFPRPRGASKQLGAYCEDWSMFTEDELNELHGKMRDAQVRDITTMAQAAIGAHLRDLQNFKDYNVPEDKPVLKRALEMLDGKETCQPLGKFIDEGPTTMTGSMAISLERQDQLTRHGVSVEDDAKYNTSYQLIEAACVMVNPALHSYSDRLIAMNTPKDWDQIRFRQMARKPYLERLAIAGALIAAQLDVEYTKK